MIQIIQAKFDRSFRHDGITIADTLLRETMQTGFMIIDGAEHRLSLERYA